MSALATYPAAPLPGIGTGQDEAAARRALGAQLGRLDLELAAQGAGARSPRTTPAAPRLLTLAELETARDELAGRLRGERLAQAEVADRQEGARRLREEILRDPAAHPLARVSNADVGEPGCLDWHVRPRFGLLGMLMRWWRVHISSGCP
jgi:hypothetical protein